MTYINPRPSPDALVQIYSNPDSNVYNGEFVQSLELEKETLTQIILFLKKYVPAKGNIFEVGCSHGDLLKYAEQEGFQVSGCDLIDVNCIHPKPNFPLYDRPLRELNLKSNFYDALVIRNTFEHYYDPQVELLEIRRILKPGGFLYIKVPNVQFENGILCKLCFQVEDLFAPPYHLNHFSPKTLKTFLEKSNFRFLSWNVEVPSRVQNAFKNTLRQLAYRCFQLGKFLPNAPLGSGATLSCIARKV